MSALGDELAHAEDELHAWATGARSNINIIMSHEPVDSFGGPVDRALTLVRIEQADAASLEVAINKVRALRLLLTTTPKEN